LNGGEDLSTATREEKTPLKNRSTRSADAASPSTKGSIDSNPLE